MKTNIIIIYLVVINIISFFTYAFDKYKAIKGKRRISEKTLCILTLLAIPIGSIISMYIFHHKTKKIKFHIVNILSIIIWLIIIKEVILNV